jgi:hypothetical protein
MATPGGRAHRPPLLRAGPRRHHDGFEADGRRGRSAEDGVACRDDQIGELASIRQGNAHLPYHLHESHGETGPGGRLRHMGAEKRLAVGLNRSLARWRRLSSSFSSIPRGSPLRPGATRQADGAALRSVAPRFRTRRRGNRNDVRDQTQSPGLGLSSDSGSWGSYLPLNGTSIFLTCIERPPSLFGT